MRAALKCIASLAVAFLFVSAAQATPLGYDDARHLLNRTGFSASEAEISEYARLSREQAVERILRGTRTTALTPPPASVNRPFERPGKFRELDEQRRKMLQQQNVREGLDLRAWWLQEMLTTSSPLTERMTLFWHNHFVSSQQKVKATQLMYRQNMLLRSYAVGNFSDMLHAVAKDPAMIIYLDTATNRKDKPNENFAREVMELFTLGEGHYTEQDIKEAARAYTGWSVEPETGEYKWRPFIHDDGEKTVLGRRGNFNGDEVLDILLAQPATSEFIVSKLWKEFISPQPDAAEVRRIGRIFRASRYDIRTALSELLLSPAFYAKENRAVLVKSPVDLVIGILRQFDFDVPDTLPVAFAVAQLGQNLFSPPNVKGWPGGEAWINSNTLLARKQVLERLFRAEEMPGNVLQVGMSRREEMKTQRREFKEGGVKGLNALGDDGRERLMRAALDIHFDSNAWSAKAEANPAGLQKLLLPTAPVNVLPSGIMGRERVRALVLDPAYQLK